MKSRKGGFTLIELLVVVAIIALLIAILLPSLGRARDQAKVVRCQSTIRSFYQGFTTYASEYEGTGMPTKISFPTGGAANSYWFGPQLLGAMWGKNSAFAASDNTYAGNVTNKGNTAAGALSMAGMLYCPAIPRPTRDSSAMDQNSYSYTRIFGDSANSAAWPLRKISSIPGAGARETLIFTEVHGGAEKGTDDWFFGPKSAGSAPSFTYSDAVGSLLDFPNPLGTTVKFGTTSLALTPHGGDKKGNMLFLDGQIILDNIRRLRDSNGDKQWIIDPIHFQKDAATGNFPW